MAAPLHAAVLEVREAAQEVGPDPVPPELGDAAFVRCAVTLITRWEVSGPEVYTRRWQGVIWPGGQSGPTWGIGYDGGHQTRIDIARDWREHQDVARLATTSGVIGMAAKQRLPEWRGITTSYPHAAAVFIEASLPSYTAAARRALGPGFVSLPSGARCALVSLGYNRGWQTAGSRRVEIRTIRDVCMVGPDPERVTCVAEQLLAMRRLWPDVKGLRDRRADEARVARGGQAVAVEQPNRRTAPPAFQRLAIHSPFGAGTPSAP